MSKRDERLKPCAANEESGRCEGIRKLADHFQITAAGKDATVGDYIRLVALEREFRGEETVSEVRVTWVHPSETESGT